MKKKKFSLIVLLLLFTISVFASIGWNVSEPVYLSSLDEGNHTGEGVSELCNLSSIRYGDVDNNSLIESIDGSLILQYVVEIDPSPLAPLPWEDWRLTMANVSGNEYIEAYDASLILQYVVGLIDVFPVEEIRITAPVSNVSLKNKRSQQYPDFKEKN